MLKVSKGVPCAYLSSFSRNARTMERAASILRLSENLYDLRSAASWRRRKSASPVGEECRTGERTWCSRKGSADCEALPFRTIMLNRYFMIRESDPGNAHVVTSRRSALILLANSVGALGMDAVTC